MRLVSKLVGHRNLLKNLILRDLKHRYVGSVGGFLWSVAHPLVMLISYSFVFSVIFQPPWSAESGAGSYPIFLFCGILPWVLFQDTIMRNCSAITVNANLITKTVIPAEILPVAITLSNLIHHAIGLGILLTVLMVFYTLPASALGILLYLPILLLFAQGLGWIVAGLQVFLRDTIQAAQILLFLWMWFTPILYALDVVPPEYRSYFAANPMAVVITGYRNSLLNLPLPGLYQTILMAGVGVAVFILGAWIFRQTKPAFADVL